MIREQVEPRPDWVARCREVGFDYCDLPSSDGSWYWSDDVAYRLSAREVDAIDDASQELHDMCMDWVAQVVQSGNYPALYGLTDAAKTLIERSWQAHEPSLFGRFDLAYDGKKIKMFEYNGDTPTSLLEASVVQWQWLKDKGLPDQFNALHEKLIDQWRVIGASLPEKTRLYFTAMEDAGREDWGNLEYLMDTAFQAGLDVSDLALESMGWDAHQRAFVDVRGQAINACFKLYPWEWMVQDSFAPQLQETSIRWLEPAWKMLLSSKALLPALWQRHPLHPLLLESREDDGYAPKSGRWISKPVLGREGANISRYDRGLVEKPTGTLFHDAYAQSGYVIQEWFELPNFQGYRPLIGSWVVGDKTAGIGIREDYNEITGNDSHFVPHYFVE